jgi:hypothetical protein
VPIVLKSGILNVLEPQGPVQGCTGIALSLPLPLPLPLYALILHIRVLKRENLSSLAIMSCSEKTVMKSVFS